MRTEMMYTEESPYPKLIMFTMVHGTHGVMGTRTHGPYYGYMHYCIISLKKFTIQSHCLLLYELSLPGRWVGINYGCIALRELEESLIALYQQQKRGCKLIDSNKQLCCTLIPNFSRPISQICSEM